MTHDLWIYSSFSANCCSPSSGAHTRASTIMYGCRMCAAQTICIVCVRLFVLANFSSIWTPWPDVSMLVCVLSLIAVIYFSATGNLWPANRIVERIVNRMYICERFVWPDIDGRPHRQLWWILTGQHRWKMNGALSEMRKIHGTIQLCRTFILKCSYCKGEKKWQDRDWKEMRSENGTCFYWFEA